MISVPFDFAEENYPLAPLTVYRVGGPARLALIPRNRAEAIEAYAWMLDQDLPKLVLGGGSNVLIADDGFPGIALFTTKLAGLDHLGDDRYYVEGGVILDRLLQEVIVANNYSGTGGLTGIPGSVGGAIYMNAGTVNGSICQLMKSVDVLDAKGVTTVTMDASLYSYRGQTFCPPDAFILSGHFTFHRDEKNQKAIYDHYIQRRKEKQPKGNSCGSVFKNPDGDHAGRLIEACGLKGTRRGGAVISDLHANFILNEGTASSSDILALIDLVKTTVLDRYGVTLREEVKIIGS
jgi:UDP-N-acetylmuramate dehydrogenase